MPEICPFCSSTASVRDSAEIYNGKSYGAALICDNYPACDSYTTLYHEGRYMADAELRQLRKTCHDQKFDPIWKFADNPSFVRKRLYGALRRLLNISKEAAHFGKLNKDQCRRVIEAIDSKTFISDNLLNGSYA